MSGPTLDVVADRVARLTDRVIDLEKQMDGVMSLQRWQMGAAVGFGVVLTLLLPKISNVLGLT
jgi:hypothetical protein